MVSFATVWEWFKEKNNNFAMTSQSRKILQKFVWWGTPVQLWSPLFSFALYTFHFQTWLLMFTKVKSLF